MKKPSCPSKGRPIVPQELLAMTSKALILLAWGQLLKIFKFLQTQQSPPLSNSPCP